MGSLHDKGQEGYRNRFEVRCQDADFLLQHLWDAPPWLSEAGRSSGDTDHVRPCGDERAIIFHEMKSIVRAEIGVLSEWIEDRREDREFI